MKTKAAWEPECHRVFVDLCVEHKLLGYKPGTQHLLEPFQQATGVRFNKHQLKNHWDTMGKQWKIWRRLINCSYMKWDPVTNTFGASDEDWANYLQVNPDAGPFRLSPPLFLKKLEVIFEGSNMNLEAGSSSKCKKKRSIRYHQEEEQEEAESADDYDDGTQTVSNFSSPNSNSKGYWSPATHELFLDLLVQETYKGNKPDTHYPKESWRFMLETINQTTGKNYTRGQLKNHWDCTRKSWKIWCQVVGERMMKWDPNTRTFGATDEDWRIYLQENPRASQFRRKQIQHVEKLSIIFQGVIEPGKAYFRSYRKKSESPPPPQLLHDPTPLSTLYIDGEDDDDDEDEVEPSPRRRRFGYAESRLQDVEIVTPIVSPMSVQIASGKMEYSIGECIECLDAMKEVEQGSDVYLFALDLFLKKEYREIFLQLKKSSLRMSWLLRLQSSGPLSVSA